MCSAEPADNARLYFFLFDFPLDKGGVVADGQCVYRVPLPAYAIDSIRTSLYTPDASALRQRWQSKTLATFVEGSCRKINADGQWLLHTVDATSWEIDTERKGAGMRRRHIYETDEAELAALAAVQPGDLIRVEVDADNWAEYAVNQILIHDEPRVIYCLRALIDYRGDQSALREGGSPATFFYQTSGASGMPLVTSATETRESFGRNPNAPSAGESQLRKMVLYVQILWNYIVGMASPSRFQSALNAVSMHLDMLLPVAWVIDQTPGNVSYLGGETYCPILFKLIPRLVWEGKPKNIRDLGQRYGFLPEGNEINAFKVHQVGEMYVNFGALGVLLGMLLLGVLYRATYQLFFHADAAVVTMARGRPYPDGSGREYGEHGRSLLGLYPLVRRLPDITGCRRSHRAARKTQYGNEGRVTLKIPVLPCNRQRAGCRALPDGPSSIPEAMFRNSGFRCAHCNY